MVLGYALTVFVTKVLAQRDRMLSAAFWHTNMK